MKTFSKQMIAWIATVAMLVSTVMTCGIVLPATAADGTILFRENFDSVANGKLPTGWTLKNDYASGKASVQDGALVIDGIGSDSQTRIFYLGSELANKGDYIYEADYTILKSDYSLSSSTRYSAMAFRADVSNADPYFYVTTRVRPQTSNELSYRKADGNYYPIKMTAATIQYELNKTYHLKVICAGTNVKFYVDDTLVFNQTLSKTNANYTYKDVGTIGFTTSNLKVALDNVVVTETVPPVDPQPAYYDTYVPDTDIINPPTVIANVASDDVYGTLMSDADYAATSLYYLDKNLNITTSDGSKVITSLAAALNYTKGKIIPAFFVKDKATVDALTTFVTDVALSDAYILSDDAELLKYARQKNTALYGVLYTKLKTAASQEDLASLVATTNAAWGKTIMVDAQYLSKDDVAYLQKRLMNVWVAVGTDPTCDEVYEVYDNTAKGVNGIVTKDDNMMIWVLEDKIASPDGTPILIREPFTYAHRGYSAIAPQNTMSAFYAAIDYGADLIEMDVKRTEDGVVVLYHDDYLYTLTDCTDQTKTVENSTWAELQALTVIENGKTDKICRLEEFLELLKESNGVVGIVEIKNNTDMALVDRTAEIIKEMGMEEYVVSIAFERAVCERMRNNLPEVSVGWLCNGSGKSTAADVVDYAKGWIMKDNLTYHPNFSDIQKYYPTQFYNDRLTFAAHRGINFQPWTYNDVSAFDAAYLNGVQGLTTDYLEYDDGYVRKLNAGAVYQLQTGVATKVQALGFTSLDSALYNCETLWISGSDLGLKNSGGKVTASNTGTAYAMLLYKVTTSGGAYYATSQPAQIKASSSAVTTATSDHHVSLLPSYTGKWQNTIADQLLTVERDERGDVFTIQKGGWPRATVSMNVPITKNDKLVFEIKADARVSVVVHLSNGAYFTMQCYVDGVELTDSNDLVLDGKTLSAEVPLGQFEAVYDGLSITSIDVYNVGSKGDEMVIKQLDLVKPVPAAVKLVGDTNGNGTVDTMDARTLMNANIGRASLTYKQARAGDINGDGVVNSTDARLILLSFVA